MMAEEVTTGVVYVTDADDCTTLTGTLSPEDVAGMTYYVE